jgi:hypothetical protein
MAYDDEDKPYRKLAVGAAVVVALISAVVYFAFFRGRVVPFEPDTVPAAGTVLLNGKPRAGIRVTYHPQFSLGRMKFTPNGTTDAAGKFTLGTARYNDGVPPGEYVVTFDFPYTTSGPIEEEIDLFKGKYSDPGKSQWKITVKDQSQEAFKLN